MSQVSVLIVGAGPTGLMLAYELARHGISFRIIDKKPEATKLSNALALQTRSLEIFKQMGIIDEFMRAGQACYGLCFYDGGKLFAELNFAGLSSIYPFILALPQATTESILNDKLHQLSHHVEFSRELAEVHQNLGDIEVVIRHQDGVRELVRCDWLVGCDGSHSSVRDKCGFTFPGTDIDEQFVVADGTIDTFLPPDKVHVFASNGSILGIFPMGEKYYRFAANLQLGYQRKILTETELKELVTARSNGLLNAQQIDWISPFWIHSKMANELRQNRVFLAGDAAHIHSPIGGQGMNTGLQDAHNLAWKLALVIQGRSDEKLLDTYQQERLPVMKEIVKITDRFTRFMLIQNRMVGFLRKYLIKLAFNIPFIKRKITERLTQLAIHYQANLSIHVDGNTDFEAPSVGVRAPDVKLSQGDYFYDHMKDPLHHLIVFANDKDFFKTLDKCKTMHIELLGPYKDLLQIHFVTPHVLDEPISQLIDDSYHMHKKYNIKNPTILMIRPDGYICYRSQTFSVENIKAYLEAFLLV